MTIAQKLVAINNAKVDIKAAIESKGVAVGSAPLSLYAAKITAITSSGSTYGYLGRGSVVDFHFI